VNSVRATLLTAFVLTGPVNVALASVTAPSDPAGQPHFSVKEYRVLGNTVLAVRDIETVLYGLLGDDKTLTDVEAARTALEKAYHDHGFGTVFVDIVPGQDVADGVVRLRATEGRLNQTTIGGARYFAERDILASLPAAAPGTVPNITALQQQLAAVNAQSADRLVVPILRAGPTPGTVDMALKVDDHLPLHGSVELNNQYTPDTKPLRATLALSYGDLFADLDALSAQYQTTPQKTGQVGVFAINYAAHPVLGGLRPSAYFINSDSAVSTIGTLSVLGKGQIAGLRLAFPLLLDAATSQAINLGTDYKHFRQSVNLDTGVALNTPISYVNLTLAYNGSWRSERQLETLNIAANFGPRGIANNPNAFENDRFQARPNYFYLRGDGSWSRTLPGQWHLSLRIAGQYTREPLISNEDYPIAGFDGVRGYLEAEVLGDTGIKGSFQLQSPPLQRHASSLADAFVFFDAGHAIMLEPLPGEPGHFDLRSYGAGIDLLPGRGLTGSVSWAMPLKAGPRTAEHEARYLFLVRGAF
jgi:hemolysin activation/secretion protein